MAKRKVIPEKSLLRGLVMKLATLVVWGVIAVGGLLAFYAYDLPDVDKALAATRRPTITIRAGDDSHLMTLGDIHGLPVGLNELPPALSQAVLATEDRRFYSHFGIDLIGLARATYANINAGRIVQGGSTLTQQVAKNLFLTPERTLKRKVQELLLALWLEQKFSKDQILTVYLNRVYLGAGTYGVEAAAKRYFRKSARSLNTYEAAMLAGLLKAPSRYNPAASRKRAHERTAQVLANMVAAGYLTEGDRASLKAGAGSVKPVKTSRKSRYFSDWVLARVSDFVSPGDTDIIVRTTLDRALQADAEKAIARGLKGGKSLNVGQAALIAMSTDGAVRAMVGGADYGLSQFNRATQARRQPGSAFKPVVFLAGLEDGLSQNSPLIDEPLTIEDWSPRNFSRKYLGPISMAEALAKSVNTVAVRISEKAGRETVINTARRLGITSDLLAAPSLALGASSVSLIEMTAAYGVFASGGYGLWPYGIEEILDGEGRVLYRRQGSGPGRVIDKAYAGAMNEMLAGVLETGTGKAANFKRPLAGKTGTSQNFRDAWFIGYSADLIAGVWMGNDNQRAMKNVTGGGIPARTWRQFMIAAHARTPVRALPGIGKQLPVKEAEQAPSVPLKDKKKGFWDTVLGVFTGTED
ncbi:MAG: PBP1A family penicillin-binding protein [Rhodospirillaceae bacterium]|jgi:penicillin-binding protein 1A|nr:PBP1A family penicillin-binding protein [Rhodospirillaceae bacterium]MBT5243098.1 PBP1A family penicillin-binding protein [Rhodospirillaceae bacterium]MBT5563323.1 PBP1A family penicillin-binding protein [Rhodospirillaceae bacterium]MBT6243637.1 PBP1A family penicillin-binding protein [Rhodospirillaceae bacterium]MBT7136431.1 PBP1A family penicillin-binding protein [Rhodospirillaceae bacterium]